MNEGCLLRKILCSPHLQVEETFHTFFKGNHHNKKTHSSRQPTSPPSRNNLLLFPSKCFPLKIRLVTLSSALSLTTFILHRRLLPAFSLFLRKSLNKQSQMMTY